MKGLKVWNAAVFAAWVVGFFVALILVGAAMGVGVAFAIKAVDVVTTATPEPTAPATVTSPVPSSWGEEVWYRLVPTDLRALITRPVAHGVKIHATATGCDVTIAVGADSATISNAASACERIIAAAKPAAPKVATAVAPAHPAPAPAVRWWSLTDPRDGEEILVFAVIGDYRLQVTRGKGLWETKEIWTVANTPVDAWTTVNLCEWCSEEGWVILVGTPEIASSSEYLLGILFPLRMTPVTPAPQVEQGIGEEENGK